MSRRLRAWMALSAFAALGCNAIFGIEEGVFVGAGGGGAGGSAGAGVANGGTGNTAPEDDSLPPGVQLHPRALTFNSRSVTHPNGALLTGELYTYSSRLGTTIDPDCEVDPDCFMAQTGSEVCVSGSTEIIPNQNFDDYYGSALQIDLGNYAGTTPEPWDRAGGVVRGLAFRIDGPQIPSVRFNVGTPATQIEEFPVYCVDLPAGQSDQYLILFDTLQNPCWDPAIAMPLAETLPFRDFVWSVTASEETALTFDFCVSDIRPIVAAP